MFNDSARAASGAQKATTEPAATAPAPAAGGRSRLSSHGGIKSPLVDNLCSCKSSNIQYQRVAISGEDMSGVSECTSVALHRGDTPQSDASCDAFVKYLNVLSISSSF